MLKNLAVDQPPVMFPAIHAANAKMVNIKMTGALNWSLTTLFCISLAIAYTRFQTGPWGVSVTSMPISPSWARMASAVAKSLAFFAAER